MFCRSGECKGREGEERERRGRGTQRVTNSSGGGKSDPIPRRLQAWRHALAVGKVSRHRSWGIGNPHPSSATVLLAVSCIVPWLYFHLLHPSPCISPRKSYFYRHCPPRFRGRVFLSDDVVEAFSHRPLCLVVAFFDVFRFEGSRWLLAVLVS